MDKISQIKKLIKDECAANGLDWFFEVHLREVQNCARLILGKLPKADKEIVMLGVWLHDLLSDDNRRVGRLVMGAMLLRRTRRR